jgi:RpiB/LacA/LacB family sugar-phosphate isomerase
MRAGERKMYIAVACDHAGFPLKKIVLDTIRETGHTSIDLGTNSQGSVDYPDFVELAGKAIQDKRAERGILICGSGVGACIAANKMKGIYAAICHDTYSAHQGVEHDDMNILCLGARIIGPELAKELIKSFIAASFLNVDPHIRRVNKVRRMEGKNINE